MAERARAVGGEATAGPDPHGGYLVSARLPAHPADPHDAATEDAATTTAAGGRREGTG
jgi:hypothetical protein